MSKTTTVLITPAKSQPELIWQTMLFNCDCHEFWDVVYQIMLAVKCTKLTASHYASTAHLLGSVAVFKGNKEKCKQVADVLGSIGLIVKVSQ